MAEPVKTESSHTESHSPILGHGIGCRLIRHVGVEGCVETGNGRDTWEHVSDQVDAGQGLWLVKRGKRGEFSQFAVHRVVNDNRVGKRDPAVHNPVADGINLMRMATDRGAGCCQIEPAVVCREVLGEQYGVIFTQEPKLETGRSGVDDKHAHVGIYFVQAQLAIAGSSSPCSRV